MQVKQALFITFSDEENSTLTILRNHRCPFEKRGKLASATSFEK